MTSIDSYYSNGMRKKMGKQTLSVIKYLQTVDDASSRKLAEKLNIERSSITRTLHNLEKKGSVIVTRKDRCPISKREVRFYGIKKK